MYPDDGLAIVSQVAQVNYETSLQTNALSACEQSGAEQVFTMSLFGQYDTTRIFFMVAEAPSSVKRGEQIGIRLLLYSTWDQTLEVILSLLLNQRCQHVYYLWRVQEVAHWTTIGAWQAVLSTFSSSVTSSAFHHHHHHYHYHHHVIVVSIIVSIACLWIAIITMAASSDLPRSSVWALASSFWLSPCPLYFDITVCSDTAWRGQLSFHPSGKQRLCQFLQTSYSIWRCADHGGGRTNCGFVTFLSMVDQHKVLHFTPCCSTAACDISRCAQEDSSRDIIVSKTGYWSCRSGNTRRVWKKHLGIDL